MQNKVISLYPTLPVALIHGKGSWIWDSKGNKYLDAIVGCGVASIGHAHPKLIKTIQQQCKKLLHTSNFYQIPEQYELAERLTKLTGMDQAYFCSTGAEAMETAIKLSRLFGRQKKIESPKIIVMDKGLHGRTMATLSASDNPRLREGFEPLVSGFITSPFNDLAALEKIIINNPDTVSIMLEPIQGEGGINIADEAYLEGVSELCDKYDLLLIYDEIQCGAGRTGKWWAYQHTKRKPHIICTGKGIGGGVAIAACLIRDKAVGIFKTGQHGSTFGGNQLSSRAALTVLDIIEEENLVENAEKMGKKILEILKEQLSNNSKVKEVRGKGLMIGIEMHKNCPEIFNIALQHGILINVTRGNVIRILPPLNISESEASEIAERVVKVINFYTK